MKNFIGLSVIFILLFFSRCEGILEEYPKDEYSEASIQNDKEVLLRVLYESYNEQIEYTHTRFTKHDLTTDYMIQKLGHFNNNSQIYQDFTWNSLHGFLNGNWNRRYRGINNANFVLDNIDELDIAEDLKKQLIAEARFSRAFHYEQLYDEFGPVPLATTNMRDDFELPRASEDEMVNFIITELEASAEDLPLTQELFGRATKGAAMGLLCKFLLNQQRWAESAALAQEIIDLGIYELYPDYVELFATSSEPNTKEFIYAWSLTAQGGGKVHFYIGDAYPPFASIAPEGVLITAAQWYVADWLVNSFENDDRRKDFFLTKYFNTNLQDSVTLLGFDKSVCLKFTDDPDAIAHGSGCDDPIIRYADILLSRAEALNELNGPSEEQLALINLVRNRAGATEYVLSDFSSKEQLRDTILLERIREFYLESKRRQDLKRHNRFISNAQERGRNAKEYHRRFPIPQAAIDANPMLKQNPGY